MSITTAPTTQGVEALQAGTWKLDPAHTTAAFVARHVLTKVRGRFNTLSGEVPGGPGRLSTTCSRDTTSPSDKPCCTSA